MRVSPAFFVVFKPNSLGHLRVGWTLSRKSGGAVDRNKVKRYLRESLNKFPDKNKYPMDCNFIFQSCTHKDVESFNIFYKKTFSKVFQKVNLSLISKTQS